MIQQPLFDDDLPPHCRPLHAPARARAADRGGAHDAAQRHNASGKAASNAEHAVDLVYLAPGRTSKELAAHQQSRLDRHEMARRLADAERAGLIHSRVVGGQGRELRWFPGESPA